MNHRPHNPDDDSDGPAGPDRLDGLARRAVAAPLTRIPDLAALRQRVAQRRRRRALARIAAVPALAVIAAAGWAITAQDNTTQLATTAPPADTDTDGGAADEPAASANDGEAAGLAADDQALADSLGDDEAPDEPPADDAEPPEEPTVATTPPVGSCSYFNQENADYSVGYGDAIGPTAEAIITGDAEGLLAAWQADPDELSLGNSALTYASEVGCIELMTLLIDNGAEVNPTDLYSTPLSRAVWSGNLAAVDLLLSRGADPNLSDGGKDRGKALHTAAYQDSPESIALLLEAGASVDGTDGYGSTAMSYAATADAGKAATALLAAGATITAEDLFEAVWLGSVDYLQAIVDAEALDQLSSEELADVVARARERELSYRLGDSTQWANDIGNGLARLARGGVDIGERLDVAAAEAARADWLQAVVSDPRVIAADQQWRDCMKAQGFVTTLGRIAFFTDLGIQIEGYDEFFPTVSISTSVDPAPLYADNEDCGHDHDAILFEVAEELRPEFFEDLYDSP